MVLLGALQHSRGRKKKEGEGYHEKVKEQVKWRPLEAHNEVHCTVQDKSLGFLESLLVVGKAADDRAWLDPTGVGWKKGRGGKLPIQQFPQRRL